MEQLAVLAVDLPRPAGLLLAAAGTTLVCCAYHVVRTAVQGESVEREMLVGGAVLTAILAVLGLLLVLAGAPAFR